MHVIVEFSGDVSDARLSELRDRGAKILFFLPERGLALSVPAAFDFDDLDVNWKCVLRARDKLSPLLGFDTALRTPGRQSAEADALAPANYIVEFYPDVDMGDARSIALESGARMIENPDLAANHLLVEANARQIAALAEWDEVSYVFPASEDLVRGVRVNPCAGALTRLGPISQSIPTVGDGWDGPGRNGAALNYAFKSVTEKLPDSSAKSEMVRAFTEWAKYVKLTFTSTTNASASRTIAVMFARGAHGDSYPFDGPGGTLAHTFYPAPSNPEPIAGDMHLDADENWHIGADTDLFSVALHETGHALGLGHSDDPHDVMYPYYRKVTGLAPGDVSAALLLYAAQDGATLPVTPLSPVNPAPPPVTPVNRLILTVQGVQTSTTAATVSLSGTVAGGSGNIVVTWKTAQYTAGTADGGRLWSIAALPLSIGANSITLTATDSQQNAVTGTFTITRTAPAQRDSTPPTLSITAPASSNVITSASSIVLSGTASDNTGVTGVTWSTSGGASGKATGTNNWNSGSIPLLTGTNTITVRASDAAGNVGWRAIVVTRRSGGSNSR